MMNMQKVGTVSSASNFEKSAAMHCNTYTLCAAARPKKSGLAWVCGSGQQGGDTQRSQRAQPRRLLGTPNKIRPERAALGVLLGVGLDLGDDLRRVAPQDQSHPDARVSIWGSFIVHVVGKQPCQCAIQAFGQACSRSGCPA